MEIVTATFKMAFLCSCHTCRYEVDIMSADEICLTPASRQLNSVLQRSKKLSVSIFREKSVDFSIKLKSSQ